MKVANNEAEWFAKIAEDQESQGYVAEEAKEDDGPQVNLSQPRVNTSQPQVNPKST